MNKNCDYKVLYDTEFAAEIAASKFGYAVGTEMVHYPCGRHWHIANKNKEKRGQHVKAEKSYCQPCGQHINPKNWNKHMRTVHSQ